MYASENSRDQVERDSRNDKRERVDEGAATEGRRTVNDPRSRTHAEEIVVERPPIVADRPQDDDAWPNAPGERRRSERRRIERMGTDI